MKQLSATVLYACLIALGGHAAEACTEIRFAQGATSAEITGDAPPDDVLCYTMRTGAGQTARIQVLEGLNVIVGVVDVADARDDLTFTTEARAYEIRVGQLMRAVQPQPFRVLVSVE